MKAAVLAAKSEEEIDDYIPWIDWRSEEEEVISAVQELTQEELSSLWPDGDYEGDFLVKWGESTYKIPLTISRVDRYVAISSLAEILKEKYSFFLRDGFDGSDTHGLLVVSNECASDLQRNHKAWLEEHFEPLVLGVDHFSGLSVPYYGHESNNPELQNELEEIQNAEAKFRAELESSPAIKQVGRDLRMKLGTATPKDKFIYYVRKYWWLLLFLAWLIYRQI